MSGRTFTLKEMVTVLTCLDAAHDSAPLSRRLRYWTNIGLISTVGKRQTGTGTSRRYSADAVRKAAILVELARYRVPTPVFIETFREASDAWSKFRAWDEAIAGTEQILLYMTYNESQVMYRIAPVSETNSLAIMLGERDSDTSALYGPLPASALVVNITRVFSQLKL
jgi:hypothetical protein